MTDPALLASKVAAGLGLPEREADLQQAAVLDHMRDRRMLLILDTCEHLVDACAAFSEAVLRAAPEVTVLATSRQPFDAPGEHAFPVAPLPIEADAVELFAQRAAAAAPGFAVTAANRADVVRLCRRLDGMPLAIELAAVRLRALPLAELADLLDSGFSVLTVTRRGGVARHQTLRTAIEWSHALCTPAEQALWRRLSVFAGSFDLPSAEEVCADAALPIGEVVHALIGLVDKSVVMRDSDSDVGGGGGDGFGGAPGASAGAKRYRLLDTLREFGGEQLAEAGEQVRFLDRLTDRYLALATDFDEHLLAGDQAGRFWRLRAEHVNISTALAHALDSATTTAAGSRRTRSSGGGGGAGWLFGCAPTGRYRASSARANAGWKGAAGFSRLVARTRLGARGTRPAGHLPGRPRQRDRRPERVDPAGGRARRRAGCRLRLPLSQPGAGLRRAVLAGADGRPDRGRAAGRPRPPGRAGLPAAAARAPAPAGRRRRRGPRGLRARPGDARRRRPTGPGALDHRRAPPDSGFALFQRPDRDDDCAAALRRAMRAMRDLGDEAGIAYCLEVLGWLAARGARADQAAWLLGAADALWLRTSGRLSNVAVMEQSHQRAAKQAREALGGLHYENAHGRGGAVDLATVVAWAADESGAVPWPDRVVAPRDDADPGAIAGAGGRERGRPGRRRRGGRARAAVSVTTLTRREREIALLVASGLSNRDIATRLYISKRTVDAHVEHIFAKLEISSRVKLTMWLQSQVRVSVE